MKKQNGFGLLEILITLVLLGVGVAGLVALARGMLGAAQEGRSYEKAMRLAESKIDEFRNFNGVEALASGATGTLYKDIAAGSSNNQTLPGDGSGDNYDLSWAVSNEYLNGGAWSTTNSASAPYPDRKRVTVTVSWSDNGGTPRTLQLAGAISPTGSFNQSSTGDGLVKHRDGPKVNYTKGNIPDVVAVALGDGNNKETSKPLPHIAGGSSSSRTVQFDTATYQTTGSTSKSQAMQDNATVYCSCTNSGASGNAYLPTFPEYIESDQVQYWKAGNQLDKSIGALQGNANQQETLCPSCCREHYDVSSQGFAGYYSPLNTSRARYRDNNGTLVAASSGDYADACRFIRIDGFYRPAPDWRLASLTTFSANFLNDATNLANYQAYIAYVVTEHAKWQKTAFSGKTDSSWSVPNSSPAIQSFNTWLVANRAGSSTTTLSTSIGTKQLISRGIYVDIMLPSYLNDEVFKGNATEPDLAKIPFQEVNMTLLSEWSSSDSNKGSITSQPIATVVDPDNNYYGTYSRGVLTAKSTTYSGTPPIDSPITITARSYQGNSGVVGAPVLPEDQTGAMTAAMLVSIDNQPIASTQGVIECLKLETTTDKNGKVTNKGVPCNAISSGLSVQGSNGVECDIVYIGHPSKAGYSCTGTPDSSFALTLTMSVGDYQFRPVSPQTLSLPTNGVSNQQCVMMVERALLTALPNTKTTCNTNP